MPPRQRAFASRNPETVRRRVIDAAQAEFMAHGYEGASTTRILANFGGSKATLFRHFPNKETMLRAVVEDVASRWRGEVDPQSFRSADPAAWMTEFSAATLHWLLRGDVLFLGRLCISEGRKFPDAIEVFVETATNPLLAMLSGKLREWSDQGRIRSADPRLDAVHFFDLAFSGVISRALYGSPAETDGSLKAHAESCVELFMAARAV
jgi:TetR/AcrR family transcriptional regulator, mexJK operon transcriptional repressor